MSDRPKLTLDDLDARIALSPFNSWLGLRAHAVDSDGVTLVLDTRAEMLGSFVTGRLHGGLIAALMDCATALAWVARDGGRISTVDLRTDFHRSVRPGRLTLRGDIVKAGRSLVVADGRLMSASGDLLATGRAVMMPTRETGRDELAA